jgi:hypothetical protein
LFDPFLQRFNPGADGFLLFVQGIALHLQALQDGGGNRLFLAQGRQGIFGLGALFRGGARGGFGL